MSVLRAFIAHEARTQLRSLRFRLLAAAYVGLSILPASLLYLNRAAVGAAIGAATYAAVAFAMQAILTALLSAILSVDAIVREQEERSLEVVGLAPLTNSGYVLRRWLAVETLVLPMTLIAPLSAAILASLGGSPPSDPGPFLWPWLLRVVPVSLAASALGIGLGTMAGGIILAAFTGCLVFWLGLGLGNDILARFSRHLSGAGDWLGSASAGFFLQAAVSNRTLFRYLDVASDAPFHPIVAAELAAIHGALALGVAAAALAAAPAFLGRTRRDVRPWKIRPDHPLRTFLGALNRVREEHGPDPAPAAADRILLAAGLLALVGSTSCLLLRAERYRARGEERLRAELEGGPEPTPASVVPGAWRIAGEIRRGGEVRLEVSAVMRNEGKAPCSHLAFSLSPDLEVTRISADIGAPRVTTAWDRVALELEPPLRPGGERRLEFHLEGTPAEIRFPFHYDSFARDFQAVLKTRFAAMVPDLSRSHTDPHISPRRVSLAAADLTPVPRYTTWRLTSPSRRGEQPGEVPPNERFFPPADLEVDLRAPEELFLADTCGNFSVPEPGGGRLQGSCRLPLTDLAVRGGPLVLLPETPGIRAVAVLPAHRVNARLHLPALIAAAEMARRAWPGLDPFRSRVILEWPPAFHLDLDPLEGMRNNWLYYDSEEDVLGRLNLLPEGVLVLREPIRPERLAVQAVASELMARRAVVPEEQFFFRMLFQAVARSRLGQRRENGAVLFRSADQVNPEDVRQPLLGDTPEHGPLWRQKLPALLVSIEQRVGSAGLVNAIEEFLSESEGLGSARELIDRISRRSGVSLERIYSDYFLGDALPVLSLEGVRFRQVGRDWEVTGGIRNLGTGPAKCPVVLRTDLAPAETIVTVDSGGSTPFVLRTPYHPRAVLLDPGKSCYRLRPVGVVERQEFREER